MRMSFIYSVALILLATACVDRVYFEIDKTQAEGISIAGFISDQPGPYEVRIYKTFDIESKESMKTAVSVKSLEIFDNHGTREVLQEVNPGIYQTSATGIRGVVGGVYTLRAELRDGKMYESLPDTILANGKVDSVYYNFKSIYNRVGEKEYSFDVLFDASYDVAVNDKIIWKLAATFQADTQPELFPDDKECFYLDEIGMCNYKPPCSGLRNVGSYAEPRFERRYPCTCCECWYAIYNDYVLLSDDFFTGRGEVRGVKAQTIPLNSWSLQYKILISLTQMSLTSNSFRMWKSIKDQRDAVDNLFQPITGKIPKNFTQLKGEPMFIEGLFYAASAHSITQEVKMFELPPELKYPISLDKPIFANDCRKLFPNSTNLKPAFWVD